MTEERTIIKKLIEVSTMGDKLTQAVMKATGCDGQYAESHPMEYALATGIYKEAVTGFIQKTLEKSTITDEEVEEVLAMLTSSAFEKYGKALESITKENPFSIAEGIVDNPDLPQSLQEHIYNTRIKPKRTQKEISPLDKPLVQGIQVRSPDDLEKVIATLKELGNSASPEEAISRLQDSLEKGPTDCDCGECDADTCDNRVSAPKKRLLN